MEDPGPTPHGALEQLRASRLEIIWPEPVVEAIHQKALPQREREATSKARREQRETLQSRPNGARLKEALEKAKASGAIKGRRQAAGRLQISVAQLSKLENGHKPLPERELQRYLRLLETLPTGRS
jgi:regulator of protease activity HflC (stomatin/prohibitin superfamily)